LLMPWPGELHHTPKEAHTGIYKVRPKSMLLFYGSLDLLMQSSIMDWT